MPPRNENREKIQIVLLYNPKAYTLPGIMPETKVINVDVAVTRYQQAHKEHMKGEPHEARIMEMDTGPCNVRSEYRSWRESVRQAVGEAVGVPIHRVWYPEDVHKEIDPQKPRHPTEWPYLPPKPCGREGCNGNMVVNGDGDYHCLLCARQEFMEKGVLCHPE